ncbi:glycosyltransferase family 2 protein [Aquabacterium sp. A7-Y]|uniref:glycosyltransferase family 2 protein n=1 Tax=Aquabacterium sp. A7-Y TaxID=1349605 RepID=UPI00223E248C|nr:glycosyltransferase family A protein [Aquabacterium sp. A7-Y]MCW7540257.1 glycosyltransferase family 2 protein [Aquabacterium sp. A7-Y]
MTADTRVDVLIPTCNRRTALAATLATLVGQDFRAFDVVVSDQSDGAAGYDCGETQSIVRLLEARGHQVRLLRNLPRRGLAQQRQVLLESASAPLVLFLDDDVLLEPDLLGRMVAALQQQRCGFVGSAVIGLSYRDDVRPQQQAVEFWDGPVQPERIEAGTPEWQRHLLHNAANLWHVQRRLCADTGTSRLYKVAWTGGCVLYDRDKLCAVGGFGFWRDLPEVHCGEDVLAQLRVMARYGGCGLMPSGAYHQELPTTVPVREVDAPRALAPHAPAEGLA